jgi:glucokinase
MTSHHPVAFGVDFGGTSVKCALMNSSGGVLARMSFATSEASRPSGWVTRVGDVCADLLEEAGLTPRDLRGVSVGAPGFVDYATGFIHELPNVPGWKSVPLGNLLKQRFLAPVTIDNDVNAMARGELAYGSGRGLGNAVFLTLGTGVGGALILNGRLYRGAYSMAGEIGHTTIDYRGVQSATSIGGLEEYIGNQSISATCREWLGQGRSSSLQAVFREAPESITPRLIAEHANVGDSLAREIFEHVAACLAATLASVSYLLQPEAFVIGGGVALSGELLFVPLWREIRRRLHPAFADRLAIHPASLGVDAGLLGCGAAVFEIG